MALEVFRLNGMLLAAENRLAQPFDLTSARWQVMGVIHLSGRTLTVAQIARRMGLTRCMNYMIWESLESFRAAFTNPEFQGRIAAYPDSVVSSRTSLKNWRRPGTIKPKRAVGDGLKTGTLRVSCNNPGR
ncbi:MAG: MarR family transcriptional regulator [Immundisolibacteraceae bacterium]|nr:MarR family transcriptional regulator [Immundisolibacteraceae bacterium]